MNDISTKTLNPRILTGLPAIFNAETRLLVLGSFPSVASLANQQYYAHPRNHFWPILSAIWGLSAERALSALPYTDRVQVALDKGLGIWDVYAYCERQGSLDSAIENAQLNDISALIKQAPKLRALAHHGGESARHMRLTRQWGLPIVKLPSTSPANASWSFDKKLAAWRKVFQEHGLA